MRSASRSIQAWLLIAAGTAAWAGVGGAPQAAAQGPRQVLVKVKAALARVLEAELPAQGKEISFRNLQSAQARTFFTDHSTQKLLPLHPAFIHLRRQTGWSDAQIAEHVRQSFPERTRRLSRSHTTPEVSRTYILEVAGGSSGTMESIISKLKADPSVEYAEPNHVVSTSSLPNDPYLSSTGSWGQSYADLWGLSVINAPAAWDISKGDGVVVAVIDTGVDYNHPDIAANMWVNAKETAGNGADDDGNGYVDDIRGWDFIGASWQNPAQSNDPIDHHGHGTHAAGIIAATGNNNVGVIGVAWNAKIMALKGLDNSGSGLDTSLAPAILYAAKNGADVINASWGGPGNSKTIEEAIQFAYSVGVVFVAAAGNSGMDAWDFYPANSPEAITVAASGPACCYSWVGWSNYGTKIDVAAPGVDILSLRAAGTSLGPVVANDYMRLDGTSMAAPHVAGLAALILSQRPGFPIENLRQTLRASANSTLGGWHPTQGPGIIDAQKALALTGALQAHFTAPAGRTRVTGPVTLLGTAQGTGFDHYILEYGLGLSPATWYQFQASSLPVASGALGTFDPGLLPDGTYTIRLTAFDTLGRPFSDRLELAVAFVSITSPSNPKVPVTALEFKPGVQIPVTGMATGPAFRSFRIEWALGIYPASGWSQTGVTLTGSGASPVATGTLGTWDTSGITKAGFYTVRVSVDNGSFTSSAVTLVYLEPDLLSQNWPQALNQSGSWYRGMVPAADAKGDILLRLVTPTTLVFPSSQLRTFTPEGLLQSSLEFTGGGSYNNPAAGDVTGSGNQNLVLLAFGNKLTSFGKDNAFLALQPKAGEGNLGNWNATPLLASLEGASAPLNIVSLGYDWSSSAGVASLYAWRGDGSMPFLNLPNAISDLHPAIRYSWDGVPRVLAGDVNGDGFKEFVVLEGLSSTTYTLGLFALDGARIPWNVPVFSGQPTALTLADLDHNGKLETILVDSWNMLHVFQPDGTERAGWPQPVGTDMRVGSVAVGDLAHSGREQIVLTMGRKIQVFNADGTPYSTVWPLNLTDQCAAPVVLADVDGDGIQELVVTQVGFGWMSNPLMASTPAASVSSLGAVESIRFTEGDPAGPSGRQVSVQAGSSGFNGDIYLSPYVAAYRLDGSVAKTWSLLGAAGNQPGSSANLSVGDFNRDGLTDIAVTYPTIEGGDASGWLLQGVATVISTGTPFNAALNDWPMNNRDAQNSSVLARVQVTPPQPTLAGVTPGSAAAGSTVTLSGSGLRFATVVKFNGTPAAFTVASDSSITATVPVGATSGVISVTTPGGTGTSASTFTVTPPVAVTVAPRTVTVLAGSQVTFTASVTGTANTAVNWSIASGAGSLSGSTATATTYIAPASAGTAIITATSQADGTKTDSATVTIKNRDFNGDGIVDVLDLATMARAFGSTPAASNWNSAADLNGDGVVDDNDLTLFLAGL